MVRAAPVFLARATSVVLYVSDSVMAVSFVTPETPALSRPDPYRYMEVVLATEASQTTTSLPWASLAVWFSLECLETVYQEID